MFDGRSRDPHLPAALGGRSGGFASPEVQRVVDRLRATASLGRIVPPGGVDPRADDRPRGRAAGEAWASNTATLDQLQQIVAAADRISLAEGGQGCACSAVLALDRLLRSAAGVQDAASEAGYVDGFLDGARAVLASVRAYL